MASRRHPRLPGLVPDAAAPSIATVQRRWSRRPPGAANDNPRPASQRRRLVVLMLLAVVSSVLALALAVR